MMSQRFKNELTGELCYVKFYRSGNVYWLNGQMMTRYELAKLGWNPDYRSYSQFSKEKMVLLNKSSC